MVRRPGTIDQLSPRLRRANWKSTVLDDGRPSSCFQLARRSDASFDADAMTALAQASNDSDRRMIHAALRFRSRRDRLERQLLQQVVAKAGSADKRIDRGSCRRLPGPPASSAVLGSDQRGDSRPAHSSKRHHIRDECGLATPLPGEAGAARSRRHRRDLARRGRLSVHTPRQRYGDGNRRRLATRGRRRPAAHRCADRDKPAVGNARSTVSGSGVPGSLRHLAAADRTLPAARGSHRLATWA